MGYSSAMNMMGGVIATLITIVRMFLLMIVFYNYPSNFALEVSKNGAIPKHLVPIVMATMDVFGFIGGLVYPKLKIKLGKLTKDDTPAIISCFRKVFEALYPAGTSFHAALIVSVVFLLWTVLFIDKEK